MAEVCWEMEPESPPERGRSLTECQRMCSQLLRVMEDIRLDRLRIGLCGKAKRHQRKGSRRQQGNEAEEQ